MSGRGARRGWSRHDRLLALRSLDGGLLEMHLRHLGDASIQSLLDGLSLLDSVFGPVAAQVANKVTTKVLLVTLCVLTFLCRCFM